MITTLKIRKALVMMALMLCGAGLLVTVFAVVALLTGFADLPCQDGLWDEALHRCVPAGY